MSTTCCKDEHHGACCCNCWHHIADYHHCTTAPDLRNAGGKDNGCVCNVQKGWICKPPEFDGRAFSGWSEHGICEMHEESPDVGL